MHSRLQLYLWMVVLLVIGLGTAAYKHWQLGFPLVPGKTQTVWTVEARIEFEGAGQPVKASLNLPDDTATLVVIESVAASPGYGFKLIKSKEHESRGVWSARESDDTQTLYYKTNVYRGKGKPRSEWVKKPKPVEKPVFTEPKATAANTLLEDAYQHSADVETLAIRLVEQLNAKQPDDNVRILLQGIKGRQQKNQLIMALLRSAEIPVRLLRGIELTDIGRRQNLQELIEVYDGKEWIVLDPRNAELGLSETFLPWQRGDQWLLEVEGGKDSKISFSVIANERAGRNIAILLGTKEQDRLVDFSLFTLPVEVQNTFSILLLIPIGALVVVILRNLVGVRTSGTFMPILIALAFLQTTLFVGIALFIVVVGVGLMIRGYLSHLNLLLVPRLAAVLIVVIALYVALSIIGFKMGLMGVLSVTYFPMIIIAWTIERMSVLWEEEGAREVMIQAGGSLLTAILAHLVMIERHVAYLFFAFPELLLVVLAIILAIGQYTGYRLSELRRFEPLTRY
ncbi:MAG: inactive transglutaminase family protein [Gammaproteobacteria bacterium]